MNAKDKVAEQNEAIAARELDVLVAEHDADMKTASRNWRRVSARSSACRWRHGQRAMRSDGAGNGRCFR